MGAADGGKARIDIDLAFGSAAAGERHDLRAIPAALAALERELPTVLVLPGRRGEPVDAAAWLAGRVDLRALDARVDALAAAGKLVLRLAGPAAVVAPAALQLATRCQRWADRRNAMSRRPEFDAALARLAALHAADLPLVRADHRHALDTWQWVLRLQPNASLALQLAALFHDVERLESEAVARREQHAPDYDAFKAQHAHRGAQMAMEELARTGMPAAVWRRTGELIAQHESPGPDPAACVLAEADALSFFSLNSDGYLDHFGPAATRRKLEWTLARLGAQGRACLTMLALRADLAALLAAVAPASPAAPRLEASLETPP